MKIVFFDFIRLKSCISCVSANDAVIDHGVCDVKGECLLVESAVVDGSGDTDRRESN